MMVAIFGPDGSGKTTQAAILAESLNKFGAEAVVVRPVLFLQKRLMGRERSFAKASPRLTRVGAGKRKRINPAVSFFHGVIMPVVGYIYAWVSVYCIRFFVGRGKVVVCDRYFYQFFYDLFGNRGLAVSRLFPKPDLAFFLHSAPETFRRRQKDYDRGLPEDYFVGLSGFLDRVTVAHGLVKIDAANPVESIHTTICRHLDETGQIHDTAGSGATGETGTDAGGSPCGR